MSKPANVMVGGIENNPTFRFIALLQKSSSSKFTDDVFQSLQDTAKELKAAQNAIWINILLQKLIGAGDDCCIQICALWRTILENNDSAKLSEKEIAGLIIHLLDKFLINKNSEVLSILTMLWGYGWCSMNSIELHIHSKFNNPQQFYKKFCIDSIKWALNKIINKKLKANQNLQERFLNFFRTFNKDELATCNYQLFHLLYTYSIIYKSISFETLYKIKITNKKSKDLINGILDFFLAITFSNQNLTDKYNEIIKFITKLELASSDKIKFNETVLCDYLKDYVDNLAIELTMEQSDMLSILCTHFTSIETEKYPLLDILFQLEKHIEFYFLNVTLQSEMVTISKAASELTLNSRTPSPKPKLKASASKKLATSKDSSSELDKSPNKLKSSKNESPSDESAIKFRLSRSDADEKDSPERISKSPTGKDEVKTPSPHSSLEGGALKKSRSKNLSHFNETISPEQLKFTKERFMKYKPKPARDNLQKSKLPLDEILLTDDELILTDEQFQETERINRAVGIWGEAALFFLLKEKYLDKYINSSIFTTPNSIKLKIPDNDKNDKKLIEIEIEWPNKVLWEEWCKSKKEQAFVDPASQPYDLRVIKKYADGKVTTRFAEVKSTPSNSKQKVPATLTGKEFRFMMANKDNYRMYRCYLAGTDNPLFVKHKNLATELIDKECEIKEIRFGV